MTINDDYIALAQRLLNAIPVPTVSAIHLPSFPQSDEKRDEFGIVFLDDGSAGPFYVSLDDTLDKLRSRLERQGLPALPHLPDLLMRQTLAERALGIGLFNALSASLMRRAGFQPQHATTDTGAGELRAGEIVGMVGYFCPLVDKLLARGCRVLVLERQPERVAPREGVAVSTTPADLAGCDTILCTAATLINDTLDELLAAAGPVRSFSLIGPTASGLPDVLFEHGITASGGVFFPDRATLEEKLAAGESWGKTGEKFQLTPANYPGFDALVAAARQ